MLVFLPCSLVFYVLLGLVVLIFLFPCEDFLHMCFLDHVDSSFYSVFHLVFADVGYCVVVEVVFLYDGLYVFIPWCVFIMSSQLIHGVFLSKSPKPIEPTSQLNPKGNWTQTNWTHKSIEPTSQLIPQANWSHKPIEPTSQLNPQVNWTHKRAFSRYSIALLWYWQSICPMSKILTSLRVC